MSAVRLHMPKVLAPITAEENCSSQREDRKQISHAKISQAPNKLRLRLRFEPQIEKKSTADSLTDCILAKFTFSNVKVTHRNTADSLTDCTLRE